VQYDLQHSSSYSYFASNFKIDFCWVMAIAQICLCLSFLLNKYNILLLENKTFPLSSKETRFKNNDKILSQFTNRLGRYQLFSKTTCRTWRAFKIRGLLREELPLQAKIFHVIVFLCIFWEITRWPKIKQKEKEDFLNINSLFTY
jgi:hypothetical protein